MPREARRLKNAGEVFTTEVVARMWKLGRSWLGRPYDLQFRWDDERLYCSELVYKLVERTAGIRIGQLEKAGDFDLSRPEVQQKLRERFGVGRGAFDPAETVISPQGIFDDTRLVRVFRN